MKVLLLLLAAGCTTSESSSLLTKGITADMGAQTTGNGTTHVSAELYNGDPLKLIYVDLEAGDQLVAEMNGQSVTLVKSELLNIISYDGDLTGGNAGDEISIDFQRTVDNGAPVSTTTLPNAFTVDPVGVQSRAQDMQITYSPSGTLDEMDWLASGDCLQTKTGVASVDNGTIVIPAGTLMGTTTCNVTITISRVRGGVVDRGYQGGFFSGAQARNVMFSSQP